MLPDAAGPYRIGRPLGRGGVASVFASMDGSGQPVALKLLGADVTADPAQLSRFRREVDALSRLRHPNVLPLLDSGVDPGCGPYLVTPLIEGQTARALLTTGAPELAALFGASLAHGLAAIHGAGLVHRDIKPENLMITADGGLVIIDFGLALHPEHSRHTREGAVTGSVPYMSPEQIAGDRVTPATDMWSLGVVLYEWATGGRPFYRARQAEEVAAILAGRFPPLDGVNPRASRALCDLVSACLVSSPNQRPTAADAIASLEAQLNWFDGYKRPMELAAAAADPRAYSEGAAPRIASSIISDVRRPDLDPFVRMREIDRGLAYAPNDAHLRSLADNAMGALPAKPAADAFVAVRTNKPEVTTRPRWIYAAGLVGTAILTGVFGYLMATKGGGHTLNMTSPTSVLQAVFEAAKNDDTSDLPGLCDPQGENDGDTRDICTMTTGSPRWPEFKSIFAASAIASTARIGGRGAEVDFFLGGGRKETMKFIRRGTNFYLYSF